MLCGQRRRGDVEEPDDRRGDGKPEERPNDEVPANRREDPRPRDRDEDQERKDRRARRRDWGHAARAAPTPGNGTTALTREWPVR
jgi:hypothetical protein